ncbi:unnamed protein product, partial [Pocillopora meandrina]
MYQNPVFSTLWKNDFRITKETFDYICQLAVALNKCVAIALWRMGTGNSYRTTGITFGQGKSTVIKICQERAFGKLKCRWRCLLKLLEEKTPKVPHTILTC